MKIKKEKKCLVEDDFENETAPEKRKRLAEGTLNQIRKAKKQREFEEEEDKDNGIRDSLIVKALMQKQLEETGRVWKAIASSVQEPRSSDEFRFIVKHERSVTAVALSVDDSRGFSVPKDGLILHWDVSSGKSENYIWPSDKVLKSHGLKLHKSRNERHSKQTLSLAVSSDGRYLVTGGIDRHVHLWDIRTQTHVKAFRGHQGIVSCVCFRQGTAEFFSGSYDKTLKMWNADEKTYLETYYKHEAEFLTIDALQKKRVLSVGRDRTMQLWKVSAECRSVYRSPAPNLECCCFISSNEFLAGLEDGSLARWCILKKRPLSIYQNAHPVIAKGDLACSWVSSVAVSIRSDLAASGAGNGCVRLWGVESECRDLRPLYRLPLPEFVNSLAFAKSGRFLIAGVGQEPRLGAWGCLNSAQNGVAIHPLRLS